MIICPNLSNPEVAKEFNEIKDAIEAVKPGMGSKAAYLIWSLNNGNSIDKAPNGAESVLFNSLLEYYNGDRNKAIVAKAKTYSTNFLKWFGNWTGSKHYAANPISKIVDKNGEPLIVWHGGAKEILIFHANSEERNNTGSGYYTDPVTGELIPFDSANAIFFSSNRYVAHSYALLYGINHFKRLYAKTQSLIETFANGSANYSKEYFKSLNELYDFLDEAGEFNPRFSKLKNYIQHLQNNKKRLSEKETNAAREMFVNLRSQLKLLESDWNITVSDWENALHIGRNIINQYYSEEGAKRLKNGEIPEYIKKEWDIYQKLQSFREKNGMDRIANYDHITIWLSSWPSISSHDYTLGYNGKELTFDYSGTNKRDVPVLNMSIDLILQFLKDALQANINSLQERLEENISKTINSKSEKYPVFLNIKSPLSHDYEGTHLGLGYKESKKYPFGYIAARLVRKALLEGNDGVIYNNLYDPYLADNYGVFSSNQIKHVDNRDWQYTGENIYHNLPSVDMRHDAQQEMLDRGLIGKYDKYSFYVTTDNISLIKDICNQYGITYNTYRLKSGRVKIGFSTKESATKKEDKIFRSPSRQEIFQNDFSTEALSLEDAVVREIVDFLREKFPQLDVRFISRSELSEMFNTVNPNANSFVIGNTVYLIKERVNSEVAIEEMLHPLVYTIANQNFSLFLEFVEEAKKDFPKLAAEIETRYNSKLGFNEQTRLLELVTQVLSRYVNKKYRSGEKGSKLSRLIDQFFNYIGSLFSKFVGKFTGKDHDFDDIKTMKLSELADIVLALDSKFHVYTTELIQYAISSRQQAAQDESQRLIVRMNVLYRQYEKMKDKTTSQLKIADRIFLTLNKLKQHRDIEAVGIALEQAKLSLGQYDPATKGPATMETANIYDFLYNAEQNNFDGVQAQQLVDMYRNTIKFYSDLIAGIPSEQTIDLTSSDINNISQIKSLIEDHIMPLWIKAIMKVGDDIVDAQIDTEVESSYENREDMKKVAKDWLHKNMMYGDINAVTSYLYNYSYSSNPIIKQAFHLIQHAEQQTLEEMHTIAPKLMKAYQKANKGINSVTPGWQSIMMEFDDKGIPTGNFIRDLNYGLYQKDLNEFIEKLNKTFIDRYGFTYVIDDTGSVVNSLTNEFADDEEWTNGIMPTYVEYQREIESFKSERAHRRFTGDYYLERLSKPYDGTIDPLSPEFTDTRFDHGLSPKALKRYSYYQSNINYYLNKCLDRETGLVYPERLEDDDKNQLDMWISKLDQFANVFEDDGSYKIGEDLKMAYEVRAWLRWIGSKTNRNRLQDLFNAELNEAHNRSISEGNPKIYRDFLRFNASAGINPDFIKLTVGSLNSGKPDTDLSLRGKLMQASLQNLVKMQLSYGRRLWEKRNDPLFWLRCKESDLYIEDAAYPKTKGSWDKEAYEKFRNNFYDRLLLYVDENGHYVDENGNSISLTDPNAAAMEEAGKLLTIRDWLINEYTNEAFTTGRVIGLIDESTGDPIDFSGMNVTEIRKLISELLSYRKQTVNDDGSITEHNEPLSIFSMLTPKVDTFHNRRTGKTEKTIIFLGERRFLDSVSSYTDPMFDPKEGIAEKPNASYADGRYDNSLKYNEMRRNKDVANLYDLLIQTMSDSQSIYTTNRKFNYKLPQINAHTAALFSRVLSRGYSTKALQSIWNSISTIEENDNDMRTKLDYFIGVDGEMANDVPLKFIRNIKDPELLSTDLVSSVIMFADMALNYKNKSAIDSTLKLLRYNMDPENRKIYNKKLKPKSEPISEDEHNKNSTKMYDSMMDVLMYGNKYGDREKGGPSKMTVTAQKAADWFLSLESSAMLGINMFSMSVGFADSITRIFSESVAGKYMTKGDCLWSLGICLWYTPKCIWNMFNPLANNKLSALMLMNGVSKGTYGTYLKADWGKGRKFLSSLLMGGWSMLDWMANALLMAAFYHNIRFYEGLKDDSGNYIIDAGFYSKYDLLLAFMRAGRSKSEANAAHRNFANIGKRITLWDAYEFAPTVIDDSGNKVKLHGLVRIKPLYEQYVTQKLKTRVATKTKKRGGLYNGMNPDNDIPRWKRDVIGRLAGALRGWIVLQFLHLVAGGTDNVAREFYNDVKYETTPSGTRTKTKLKKRNLTDEQRSRRMSWDYESGTPQDQILIGLWRSFRSLYKTSVQLLIHKPKTAKLSEVEKYAWKDSLIFLGMLAMMMVGWTYIHDDARTVQAPLSREEAGPATMWNPVDYYDYMRDVYIPNQYWKLGVDDIYFRTVEAKISNVNPKQVLDIVSALTALKSGLDDQLGIVGIGADLINGEDNSEVLKQGAYKFYTKGDRTLYRAIGPAKNLHTAITYYGATNNLRWYTNKFGKLYRAFGYDFKKKDKDAASKNNSNFSGGDFSGGSFSGGDFSGGDFSGGNF